MTDEKNWVRFSVYEWQDVLDKNGRRYGRIQKAFTKSNKVQAEQSPNQPFSFALWPQTRACASFRQVSLGMCLRGFKPNVADEIDRIRRWKRERAASQTGPAPRSPRQSEKCLNEVYQECGQQQQQEAGGDPNPKLLAWKENNEHDEKIHISYPQASCCLW